MGIEIPGSGGREGERDTPNLLHCHQQMSGGGGGGCAGAGGVCVSALRWLVMKTILMSHY